MASDRYRYRQLGRIRLRDDGYRIEFQLEGADNVDPEEWTPWAEYKQCDLPGPAQEIADVLMGETEPAEDAPILLVGCDVVGCESTTPMDPATWEDGAPQGWRRVEGLPLDSAKEGISTASAAFTIATHGMACPRHHFNCKED